tara:strand:- start:309 stop:623 length:315 start_codon:yes stop_codon:yes gene_type:complete
MMGYKFLYKAENYYEAHFIKGLLKKYSIQSKLIGENLCIGVGELPVDAMQVDILVIKSKIIDAKRIMTDYKNNLMFNNIDMNHDWKCEICDSLNPSNFEICWNC